MAELTDRYRFIPRYSQAVGFVRHAEASQFYYASIKNKKCYPADNLSSAPVKRTKKPSAGSYVPCMEAHIRDIDIEGGVSWRVGWLMLCVIPLNPALCC